MTKDFLNLFSNIQRSQYANHGSNNSESQPTVKAFDKEEITCNQARKQKCNYRAKQSIHAYTLKAASTSAIVMQIALIVVSVSVCYCVFDERKTCYRLDLKTWKSDGFFSHMQFQMMRFGVGGKPISFQYFKVELSEEIKSI